MYLFAKALAAVVLQAMNSSLAQHPQPPCMHVLRHHMAQPRVQTQLSSNCCCKQPQNLNTNLALPILTSSWLFILAFVSTLSTPKTVGRRAKLADNDRDSCKYCASEFN